MIEEEYFRKNYPNSCYGDKPLSPHWDFFQDGVEFGEQQSEKRIEELEKENAELEKQLEETKLQNAISEEGLKNLIAELERKNESLENIKNIYIGDLLKAKEIIKKLKAWYTYPIVTEDDLRRQDEILSEVEQFLNSEV